jgi:hypothetical protein
LLSVSQYGYTVSKRMSNNAASMIPIVQLGKGKDKFW